MAFDEDDAEDPSPVGPLLPPEDRLWRHPSEMSTGSSAPVRRGSEPTAVGTGGRQWALAALTGIMGAALAVGCIALFGDFTPGVGNAALVTASTASIVPLATRSTTAFDSIDTIAAQVGPAVASLEVDGDTTGSAIVIRNDGYLVTNAHLVDGKHTLAIVFSNGRRMAAKLVGADDDTDVAVVKVAASDMATVTLGSAADITVGQSCMNISSPRAAGRRPVIVMGVVRGVGRPVSRAGASSLIGMIETDAPEVDGASGGALVDSSGAVIGLANRAESDSDNDLGSYATPIDVADAVAMDIITTGHARHPWLGVQGADLDTDDAASLGVDGAAVVSHILSASPAETAALQPGDVIVAFNGQAVTSMSQLVLDLRAHRPGDLVSLTYYRGQARRSARVTLVDRPDK